MRRRSRVSFSRALVRFVVPGAHKRAAPRRWSSNGAVRLTIPCELTPRVIRRPSQQTRAGRHAAVQNPIRRSLARDLVSKSSPLVRPSRADATRKQALQNCREQARCGGAFGAWPSRSAFDVGARLFWYVESSRMTARPLPRALSPLCVGRAGWLSNQPVRSGASSGAIICGCPSAGATRRRPAAEKPIRCLS
jgi:hypothetical protein